jgi:hypothetical protein
MPYPVQKYIRTLNQFCVATNAFTPEEVDKIIDLEDLQKFQNGAVGGGGKGQVNKKTRDSEVMWVMHDQNSDWLYQKFSFLNILFTNQKQNNIMIGILIAGTLIKNMSARLAHQLFLQIHPNMKVVNSSAC